MRLLPWSQFSLRSTLISRSGSVGHAEKWDETIVEGDLPHRDALVRFRRAGSDLAVATVERDEQSLCAELAMESDFRRPS